MQNFPLWQKIGYVILIVSLLACGAYFYKVQEQSQQKKVEDNLHSIARLKASQIADWRNECLSDAYVLMESIFLAYGLPEWMKNPRPDLTGDIQSRMRSFQKHHKYEHIIFVNLKGEIVVSTDESTPRLHPDIARSFPDALKQHRPLLFDLQEDPTSRTPHLTIIVPLFTRTKNPQAIGVFILMIDAGRYLFPLIENWPGSTETAETLLVRRDGNHVIFLNELRHRQNTAMKLRIPLDQKEVPAVMAVSGRTGMVEGKDYRGEDVISFIMPVPDSPWFIVTKMDQKEAFAAWRFRSVLILASLAGLIALIIIAGLLIWQRREKEFYLSHYVAERKNSTILHSIGDAVIVTDASGLVEMLNPTAERLTGWTHKEACGKPLETIFHIVNEDTRTRIENFSGNILNSGQIVKMADHTILVALDGIERPIDDSAAPVFDENGKASGMVLVFHDCTDERQAQKALKDSEQNFRNLFENAPVGIFLTNARGKALAINKAMAHILSFESTEDALNYYQDLGAQLYTRPQRRAEFLKRILKEGRVQNFEYEARTVDGRTIWLSMNARIVQDQSHEEFIIEGFTTDITQRRRMQEALRESEEKYRTLFDASPQGILLADLENRRFVYGNPAICNMLGHQACELEQLTIEDIHPADSLAFAVEEFEAMSSGKINIAHEMPCKRKDGSLFYANISGIVITIGGRKCNLGFFTDVTERRQAIEKLKESEERYRLIFEGSPNGILIVENETQKHIYANPAISMMLGYSQAELREMSFADIYVPEIRKQALEDFQKQAMGQKTMVYNIPCVRKDKSIVFADIGGTRTVLDGQICNVGFFTDVTERKKAEEKLHDAFQTSDDIIRIIPSGLYIYQYSAPDRLHLIAGNQAAQRLTGLDTEKMKGWEFNEIFPKAAAGGLTDLFLNVIRTGQTFEAEDVPYEDKHISGSYRIRAFSLPGERLAVAFENITERKKAEQEKAKLEAQLAQAQKMESVGRLAGGVAHDFNNMLSIILGHAEMALSKIDQSNSLHADLTSITKAATRSADLTRQLLAFARKQTIAPKVLDLNDTVMGMLKMLQRLIGEEINLVWSPGANLSPVMVDPGQIDQMLANLCINARDAIVSTGKITIETKNVHFSAEFCDKHPDYIPGKYVLLAVSDNGCGMDKATIGHLFEPFFTTKDIGRGTGLGLATVYGIVKQNSGFISVYSEPGVGSTFKIYLPRHEGKELEKQGEQETTKLEKGQGLILLVEDEAAILQMGKQMLERLGYNVLTANTPGEAQEIAIAYTGVIDLLITDVIMPEMNGRDLALLLAKSNPAMKQLFMSGYTADAIAHHGVLDEGIEFIQKPFSIRELSAKIKEVMSN